MVVTAADLASVKPIRPLLHKFNYVPISQPVLAKDVVRFVGEPVAAVVASTPEQAEDLAELVEVEIEPTSPVVGARADDAQEHLLDQVLAVLGRAEEARQEGVDPRGVALDEPVEGVLVPLLVAQHPAHPGIEGVFLAVVGGRPGHRWVPNPTPSRRFRGSGRNRAQLGAGQGGATARSQRGRGQTTATGRPRI